MSFADILLYIDSYPEPTPTEGVDQAVAFAKLMDSKLTALALAIDIPHVSNRVADYLIGLSKLEKQAEERSLAACRAKIEHFKAAAKSAGLDADAHIEKTPLYAVAETVARRARTRDLCLVPLTDRFDGQIEVVVAAVFDSGRPVLGYKSTQPRFVGGPLREVVIAWDGSRSAARAVGDSLPMLARSGEVRIVSVLQEKVSVHAGAATDLRRHLQSHGIQAAADEVEAAGRPIGRALAEYLAARKPDILVMGAYGHSRVREFVLGGATEYMLHDPPLPVFLSH